MRDGGVPPAIVAKMEHGDALTPRELVMLTRRGVPDSYALRHLEESGADYLVTRSDALIMRRGGVSARVIDAVLAASDRFAGEYHEPGPAAVSVGVGWSDPGYYGSDYYFDHGW